MSDPFAHPPRDLIDLARYPLDDPRGRAELMERCRRELAAESCVMLPGFVTGQAVRRMISEAMAILPRASRRDHDLTPYGPPRTDLPADDPRTITSRSAMHVVAGDDLAESAAVQRLYRWDGLTRFIAEVVEASELYRVLDPIFNCNLSIIGEGDGHHWHFDSNDFVVTLLLQQAEAGGDFEFAPYIRSEEDENYTAVAEVLRGGRDGVKTVRVEPGTLVLFCGKRSVHRVSPVEGKRKRVIALYSYDKRPDKMFSDESAMRVFNRRRTTPAAAD
ncbi:MAG: 2OG-Fe(II) oxygenase [Alphaproteobacteria bacterium]|nr:2OG-Fe(II) oxygenase [Alphaproteobacteria bacterium]